MPDTIVTVKTLGYATAYAMADGEIVAFMQRSPFSGEWCYGERNGDAVYPRGIFRPPFKQTLRKTPLAAAKVAVAEIHAKETGA